METKDKQRKFNSSKPIVLILTIVMLICCFPVTVFASDEKTQVTGQVYEFEKDSHYEFQNGGASQKSDGTNTYGIFSISGNIISVGEKSGVPSYEVSDGSLSFFYNYADTLLNADVDSWHLIDDKSKKVAELSLKSNIMKGAIILQTSKDQNNWINVETIYNAFEDTPYSYQFPLLDNGYTAD